MDRSYSTPGDVSNASSEDVARALNRVLRRIEGTTQFIYQAEFEYANGRKEPLIMVGALRGAWREYIRRHASSSGFAAGACEVHRDDSGKLILELKAHRGKGTNRSHERSLNSGPLRRAGAEARFVPASTASSGTVPSSNATEMTADALSEADQGDGGVDSRLEVNQDEQDIGALGKSILERFSAFKKDPTMEQLTELMSRIDQFRELRASGAETEANVLQQIEQIARLLENKGRAFVEQKGGGSKEPE